MRKVTISLIVIIAIFVSMITINAAAQTNENFEQRIEKLFSGSITPEKAMEEMQGDYSKLSSTEHGEEIADLIEEYSALRKSSLDGSEYINEIFPKQVIEDEIIRADKIFSSASANNTSILKSTSSFKVESVTLTDNGVNLSAYEWIFYLYDESGFTDISGYGVDHKIEIGISDEEVYFVSSQWSEDTFDKITSSGFIEEITEIEEAEENISTSAILGAASYTYSADLAVAYADKYALDYNTAYPDYNSYGGDCANFVAQCIAAGGFPTSNDFYIKGLGNASISWVSSTNQRNYLSSFGKVIDNPEPAQVLAGNPVYYGYDVTTTKYAHSAICTGKNTAGTPVVNAHNNDRYRVNWQLGSGWDKRSTVQLKTSSGVSLNKELTINPSSLLIKAGSSSTLSAVSSVSMTNAVWSSSNTAVAKVSNGTVTAVSAGTAVISVTAGAYQGTCAVEVMPNNTNTSSVNIKRIAGNSRFGTAAAVSEEGWTSADTVILASATVFADSLSAVPLSRALNAPILITGGISLESDIESQIKKLGTKKVVIIGGEKAISSSMQTLLEKSYTVERISGQNRYKTSVAVAKKLDEINGTKSKTAVLVTADNYADALSISPIAAMKGYPILYTSNDGNDADVISYLKNVSDVVVVGGTTAISNTNLKEFGTKNIKRLSGANRYLTGLSILKEYKSSFSRGYFFAKGTDFPDALAGGALAAKYNYPLLLIDGNSVNSEIKTYVNDNKVVNVFILGGTSAVSSEAAISIFS